jgi:hypothetical protein
VWLYLPRHISAFSAVAEDLTSPSESLLQRLAASAMWRQKFLQPRIWRRVLKTVPWMRLLSGLTCEPSTADRGVASWMESLRGSRAQTTRSLAGEPGSSANTVSCGTTCGASLARFSPDGCSWRTSQASLFPTSSSAGDGIVTDTDGRLMSSLPDSGLFLETWPRWGSMRNGVVYPQPKWVLPTNATGGSAWPTARAEDSECCGNHPNAIDSLGGQPRRGVHQEQTMRSVEHSIRTTQQERT